MRPRHQQLGQPSRQPAPAAPAVLRATTVRRRHRVVRTAAFDSTVGFRELDSIVRLHGARVEHQAAVLGKAPDHSGVERYDISLSSVKRILRKADDKDRLSAWIHLL